MHRISPCASTKQALCRSASRCGAPTRAVIPCAASAIVSTARFAARTNPGRRSRSSAGYPVTHSSGKRTRSAFAARARSSQSTTLPALPSMSPTTLLICASASLIGFRLSVENSSSPLVADGPPPEPVEEDRREEDSEPEPVQDAAVLAVADVADHRGDDDQRDQQRPQPVGAHTGPVWIAGPHSAGSKRGRTAGRP